ISYESIISARQPSKAPIAIDAFLITAHGQRPKKVTIDNLQHPLRYRLYFNQTASAVSSERYGQSAPAPVSLLPWEWSLPSFPLLRAGIFHRDLSPQSPTPQSRLPLGATCFAQSYRLRHPAAQ